MHVVFFDTCCDWAFVGVWHDVIWCMGLLGLLGDLKRIVVVVAAAAAAAAAAVVVVGRNW